MTERLVEFRNMTKKEFGVYLSKSLTDYSKVRARAFKQPFRQERLEAKRQIKGLLPHGLATKDHSLLSVVDLKTAKVVGSVWVHVDNRRRRAFLYDIVVFKQFRSRGYGKAIMGLLDATLKARRIRTIGLHVFAENSVALNLYRKQGYEVGSYNMVKELDKPSGSQTPR